MKKHAFIEKIIITCLIISTSIQIADSQISIIGNATPAANWVTDFHLTQDTTSIALWTTMIYLEKDSAVKFRANESWEHNWGGLAFPNGTLEYLGGENIMIDSTAHYIVSFDSTALTYAFAVTSPPPVSVGIGTTTPDASAALDIQSLDQGILIPRTDTTTVNQNTPAEGLLIYQESDQAFYSYNGNKWVPVGSGSSGVDKWMENGNDIYYNDGNVGIGADNPQSPLHISSSSSIYSLTMESSNSSGGAYQQFENNASRQLNLGINGSTHPDANTSFISYYDELKFVQGFNNEAMRILQNGNVGIGTDNPLSSFHIESGSPNIRLQDDNHSSDMNAAGAIINAFGSDGASGSTGRLWYLGSNSFNTKDAVFGNQLAGGKLLFSTEALPKMTIDGDGKVGIGNTSPVYDFEVIDQSRFEVDVSDPTYLKIGNMDQSIITTSLVSAGSVQVVLDDNNNDLDTKSFEIIKNGTSGTTLFRVNESGTVGIGTTNSASSDLASGYKLSVNGKIAATEVRVQPTIDWPDYVFESEYKLMPLNELQKSIKLNNHLPGIPSASQVKEEGIMVGEMQTLMMEKIEELTLYIIDLQKQITQLKNN